MSNTYIHASCYAQSGTGDADMNLTHVHSWDRSPDQTILVNNFVTSTPRSLDGEVSFTWQFEQHPLVLAVTWFNRVYLLVILVAGSVGNTLILVIQRRVGHAVSDTALSVFICSLAVSDMCMLTVGVTFWFLRSLHIDISTFHDASCKLVYFFLYVLGQTSSWFLVSMTTHRAACILWPHKMEKSKSSFRAKAVVVTIVLLAALENSHILYGFTIVHHSYRGQSDCGFQSEEYQQFFTVTFAWMDSALSSLLPFAFLAVSNGVIMMRVGQALRDARHTLAAGTESQLRQRQSKTSSMNVTLISVSFTFVALTLPICVIFIKQFFRTSAFQGDVEEAAKSFLVETLGTVLWLTNNSINFYIYVLTGSKYRAELLRMLVRREAVPATTTETATLSQ